MKDTDEVDDLWPGKRIIDVLAVAPGFHEIVGPQSGQLLGHCGLAKAQDLLKLRDGLLALYQETKNNETSLVGNRLQEFAGLPRIGEESVNIRLSTLV
jgi:hypothetical protein